MKKFFVVLLAVMLAGVCSCACAVEYGGTGYQSYGYSESTAWEISSATTLLRVRDDVNAGRLEYECYFKLMTDIDLTGYQSWTPIGGVPDSELTLNRSAANYHHFAGCFDGNGHTIKINIHKVINGSDAIINANGLFGTMDGGYIKNLNVSGSVEVYGRSDMMSVWVGGVVAYVRSGSIENCKFDGDITAKGEYTEEIMRAE